jgi:isopenicillin N synthase-like dioxygenase
MASGKATSALPVINIAPWVDKDGKGRLSTSAAIHAACLEYGFFYLDISSVVDPGEPEELVRLAREFFGSPQEEKDKISFANQDHARGMFSCAVARKVVQSVWTCRLSKAEGERHKWTRR